MVKMPLPKNWGLFEVRPRSYAKHRVVERGPKEQGGGKTKSDHQIDYESWWSRN